MRSCWTRTVTGICAGSVTIVLLAGCSAVSAVRNAVHKIESNKSTVDAFTGKLQTGEATPFEATYVTSGAAPATVIYAVRPPQELLFSDTGASGVSSDGQTPTSTCSQA